MTSSGFPNIAQIFLCRDESVIGQQSVPFIADRPTTSGQRFDIFSRYVLREQLPVLIWKGFMFNNGIP
jgi:hypothetical protein